MEINYLSTRAVDEAGEDNRDVDWQPCRSTVKQQWSNFRDGACESYTASPFGVARLRPPEVRCTAAGHHKKIITSGTGHVRATLPLHSWSGKASSAWGSVPSTLAITTRQEDQAKRWRRGMGVESKNNELIISMNWNSEIFPSTKILFFSSL